jgi:uncharacterized membrane protein (UPF0127 family)
MVSEPRPLRGLRNGRDVRVVNRSTGEILAASTRIAARPWTRMRGLLGRTPLTAGEGLLIVPCQGVHTFGMAYPIDVVHLDRSATVRRVLRNLAPGRLGPIVWSSHAVLELPAGEARAHEGDQLAFEPTLLSNAGLA